MITKSTLSDMLRSAARQLAEHADEFSAIDSTFGDGDHGVAVKKIAAEIENALPDLHNRSIKDFIETLGTAVMGIGGGAAGPLWGTLLGGLALPLPETTQAIDAALLKAMLAAALEEMETITTARVGDKTMMDTLIPAVQAAQAAPDDVSAVLQAAAAAARQGAKDTQGYVARFGRAKNYKEQTIGTPDAGAMSLMIFFQGLASGVK